MATQTVTPIPEDEAAFQAQLQQILAEGKTPPPDPAAQQPPATQPITVTIDGQVRQFSNPAEVSQAMQAAVDAARAAMAAAQAPAQRVTAEDDRRPPEFSNDKFLEYFQKSPNMGLGYQLSHALFDGKVAPDEAIQNLRIGLSKLQDVDRIKAENAALLFLNNHPEIPRGAQGVQVGEMISTVMQQRGLTNDVRGYETAYELLRAQATAQQWQQQQAGQQPAQPQYNPPPNNGAPDPFSMNPLLRSNPTVGGGMPNQSPWFQQATAPPPPPSMPRGGTGDMGSALGTINNLSDGDLLKLIEGLHSQGYRG